MEMLDEKEDDGGTSDVCRPAERALSEKTPLVAD
jgi:hypothetical protein